MKKYLTTIY